MDKLFTDAGSDYHWHPQPCRHQVLGEVRHRLVDVFFWQLFADGLQSDFQLVSGIRLRLEFMAPFQHDASDMIVQSVKSGGLGPLTHSSQ